MKRFKPTIKLIGLLSILLGITAFGVNALRETTVEAAAKSGAYSLTQCSNFRFGSVQTCSGDSWVSGNINKNKGFYHENESIPYRVLISGLTVGSSGNTVTIQWDTTEAGKHAIDYPVSYNRNETNGNNPLSGVVPACGTATTIPIPLDPNVTAAGVTQTGGQLFTMWGGTMTNVSGYTLSGTYAGRSSTSITITFTADKSNPVLAWAGHLAYQGDWSDKGGSAAQIIGSPYHTRVLNLNGQGGNQDRTASTVTNPLGSKIIIVKQATPEGAQEFDFTTTGTGLSNFTLVDDGNDNDATPNNITFSNLAAGPYSVMETSRGDYSLTSLNCVIQAGGTSSASINVQVGIVNITLQEGDTVTCAFFNAIVPDPTLLP